MFEAYEPGKQTYRQYAGFDTQKMRQKAIAYGCQNDDEIEVWLEINFGRDQNTSKPIHYQYLRRKKRKRGRKAPQLVIRPQAR